MIKPFQIFRKENQSKGKTDFILIVDNLVKTYDNFRAVDGISFSVKRGSLFAFLGLNGAGKSTTINIITQILSKDSGTITIDGMNLDKEGFAIKNEIGIVFQNSVLDPLLTPRENLTIRAGFYGIHGALWKERFKLLVDMLDLESFLDRPVGKLSGGQRRRVDIARAMVHDPKLLILDEPTTGLDPQTRLGVWNLVNELRAQTGMTVFLTTHYMEEAEKATYVVIMDKGHIIATGTPTELKNQYSGDYVFIYQKKNEEIDKLLSDEGRKYHYNRDGHYYKVTVTPGDDVLDFIQNHRLYLSDFEVEKGNMDDVFLNVTGVREIMEGQSNE
jgi:multidrug/hemolysin transport system ATP-binding protein